MCKLYSVPLCIKTLTDVICKNFAASEDDHEVAADTLSKQSLYFLHSVILVLSTHNKRKLSKKLRTLIFCYGAHFFFMIGYCQVQVITSESMSNLNQFYFDIHAYNVQKDINNTGINILRRRISVVNGRPGDLC